MLEGPDPVYKKLSAYDQTEIDNFVKAPDNRKRKPVPLYEWEDMDNIANWSLTV